MYDHKGKTDSPLHRNYRYLYPEELWDSLQELSEECEKIDPDSHFRKAFDSVIEKVYREGFKDGLALSAWLENGTPDHRL